VVAIASGLYHCLALKADGTITAWGTDFFGQVKSPGGLNGMIAIAAGHRHKLALYADGTVLPIKQHGLSRNDAVGVDFSCGFSR